MTEATWPSKPKILNTWNCTALEVDPEKGSQEQIFLKGYDLRKLFQRTKGVRKREKKKKMNTGCIIELVNSGLLKFNLTRELKEIL